MLSSSDPLSNANSGTFSMHAGPGIAGKLMVCRASKLVVCRASKLVEDGLGFYRAQHAESGVPTGLQRDLLEEACAPDALQATTKLKGNRLACKDVNGARLIAHPVGQAGERLCLSVLRESSDGGFQVKPITTCTLLSAVCLLAFL